ncbi:hypothetical protein CYY_005566 [Polysphondylium violaceum]|uniref:FNIP repeat-containing protein n=1 Tax=Polysphondylium violaceum TaxID=133409 RepID=A0A8J4UYM2_9MYCE|nr:hypothetical protein CYY_005566 [Polysphondylium violaceum]
MDLLFYNVYRNVCLRKVIRNYVIGDKEIIVSVNYLERNFNYLKHIDGDGGGGGSRGKHISVVLNNANINSFKKLPAHIQNIVTKVYLHCNTSVSFIPQSVNTVIIHKDTVIRNVGDIPHHVTHLEFREMNRVPFKIDNVKFIPNEVVTLKGALSFNNPQEYKNFSHKLASIELYIKQGMLTDTSTLPPSVRECTISGTLKSINMSTLSPKFAYTLKLVEEDPPNTQPLFRPLLPNSGNLYIKTLDLTQFDFYHSLKAGDLPDGIEVLIMYYTFQLAPGVIPSSVTDLSLHQYNLFLDVDILPNKLERLYMLRYNQCLLPRALPSTLTELNLHSYNQPIYNNVLPNRLKKLTLVSYQKEFRFVGLLPSLTFLKCRYSKSTPPQIGSFPNNKSLHTLYLLDYVDLHPKVLPDSIKDLSIVISCTPNSIINIPDSVEKLRISSPTSSTSPSDITIDLNNQIKLPPNLTHLTLGYNIKSIHADFLPNTLVRLTVESTTTFSIIPNSQSVYIPPSVKYFSIFNYPSFPLPPTLTLILNNILD